MVRTPVRGQKQPGENAVHGRHALDIAGKSPRAMGRPIGGGGTRGSSAVLSRDVGFMPLRLAPASAARNRAHPRRGIGLSSAPAWGNRAMCGEVDHVAQPADLGMCDRAKIRSAPDAARLLRLHLALDGRSTAHRSCPRRPRAPCDPHPRAAVRLRPGLVPPPRRPQPPTLVRLSTGAPAAGSGTPCASTPSWGSASSSWPTPPAPTTTTDCERLRDGVHPLSRPDLRGLVHAGVQWPPGADRWVWRSSGPTRVSHRCQGLCGVRPSRPTNGPRTAASGS